MDSLFIVTIHMDSCVSIYFSFSERYTSLSCIEFKSLQCADIRHTSLQLANNRKVFVLRSSSSAADANKVITICKFADSCVLQRQLTVRYKKTYD